MKNPIVLSILAVFAYAITNIIIDRKLAQLSPVTTSLVFCSIIVALCLGAMGKGIGGGADWLTIKATSLWPALIVAGIVFFMADILYLGAYKAGGNVVTISTIISLFPIAVFLIELVMGDAKMSGQKAIGLFMAVGSVYLITKK